MYRTARVVRSLTEDGDTVPPEMGIDIPFSVRYDRQSL
jgi:hypothetical protein